MQSSPRRRQTPTVRALAATVAASGRFSALAEPPETAEVTDLTRHGLLRFQAGDYDQASRIFSALVGGAPDRAVSWNHHALALVALGRDTEATHALRRSLQIHPGQLETWESLAGALSRLNRHDEAEAACRAAQTLGGDSAVIWQVIAMARSARDDFAAAAEAFARVIILGGESGPLCASLGLSLLKSGQFGKAQQALAAAVRLDPTSAPIAQALTLAELIAAGLEEVSLEPRYSCAPDEVFKAAVLLLDAHGQRQAASRIATAWAALRPADAEASHLRDALLARPLHRQPPELVAKTFDNMAETFDTHLVDKLGYDGPAKLAALLAPLGAPGGDLDVLDLGCGTGLCAPVLRPYARRLTGVDLSAGMLAKAKARNLYDGLACADLADGLAGAEGPLGLVVAFDTFPYLGALETVFDAVSAVLPSGGWYAFSTEHSEDAGYTLRGNGRFAHGAAYIEDLAAGRFAVAGRIHGVLRREAGRAVAGAYYLLRRT